MDAKTMYELAMQYIKPELLVLIPILWAGGNQLKKTPAIADWKIPWMLLAVSSLFSMTYCILMAVPFDMMAIWIGAVQGCLIWAVEGQLYQTHKQTVTKK